MNKLVDTIQRKFSTDLAIIEYGDVSTETLQTILNSSGIDALVVNTAPPDEDDVKELGSFELDGATFCVTQSKGTWLLQGQITVYWQKK